MDRKRLAYSLLLVAVAFVAVLHTILSFAYQTGLAGLGAVTVVACLVLLAVVNL